MNETSESGQRSKRQLSNKEAWLMAAVFAGMGLMIVAMAFDLIHVEPSDIHAPRWVLAAGGMMFLFAGLLVPASNNSTGKEPSIWARLLGLLMLGCLAAVFNWVAFGPGEREFTTTINDFIVGGGELFGRWVFGFFAVLMDLLLIWSLYNFIRQGLGRAPVDRA